MAPREDSGIRQVASVWKSWVIIFTPFLLIPLPLLEPSPAGKCAYVILIMAVYWMTEAIPIAATALLPLALMPWLGVMGAKPLSQNYLKDTNMLFVGGLLVAVAVEKWNLHKRIALGVLLFVGSKPRWLLLGFMGVTAFLSMWLSNTATTAMMIPIAQAVLSELDAHRKLRRKLEIAPTTPNYSQLNADTANGHIEGHNMVMETVLNGNEAHGPEKVEVALENRMRDDPEAEVKVVGYDDQRSPVEKQLPDGLTSTTDSEFCYELTPEQKTRYQKEDDDFSDLRKGLTLCVAYAANIGGTATLTGTGPNLIIKGQVDTLYGPGAGLNFSSWFIFAFPNMVVSLILAWIWLQALYLGPKVLIGCCLKNTGPQDTTANEVIKREYRKLGPWTFAEIATLFFFIMLALLWLTREPEFMPGWAALFQEGYVTDASVAITIGVMLFMFPSEKPNILCFRKRGDERKPGPVPALLDWETVHHKMAWNVIIVLGGGFAIADACKVSGLSKVIGDAFAGFSALPVWSLVLILCIITAGFTEVASNTATATIFLPILAELAVAMHVNPLYLMIPVTVATSLAFMLPVATPPNAMVFAYGHMKIIDMIKAGILMNILCILALTLAVNTWGFAYFDFGTFPDWALDQTTVAPLLNITDAML